MNGIKANIAALTSMISSEATKRGSTAPVAATPGAKAAVPGGVANLTVARMQRALIDLGALVGDSVLRIASDGIVGPKTTAAINKAISSYIPNAPAGLKQKLSAGQVSAMADVIASQVEAAVAAKRAVAAREEAKGNGPGPTATPEEAQAPVPDIGPAPRIQEPAYTAPTPAAVPSEPSYTPSPSEAAYARQTQQAPAPTYAPSSSTPDYSAMLPPSAVPGGGQEIAPTPGADVPAPAEKKKFPWMWVGVGAGVAVLGGIAIIAFSKKRRRTARRRLVPAHA